MRTWTLALLLPALLWACVPRTKPATERLDTAIQWVDPEDSGTSEEGS